MEQIEHSGIIKEIKTDGLILVSILSGTGCSSCSVKGSCSASEVKEKIIELKSPDFNKYKEGQSVNVFYKQSLGFKALFLGYIFPFIIMFVTLIISINITENEGFSGLLAIGILAPYYLMIYFFKNKIRETFSFSIKAL